MYGCVEFQSPMTGSTRAGPLQPPEDSAPLPAGQAPSSSSSSASSSSSCDGRNPPDTDDISGKSPRRRQDRARKKMSPVRPTSGQPIQLTPLWEHVVRTQRFPTEVDTRETFGEISERLRDPEWEVRQHALRVLVDVLPTLGGDVVDEAMLPVLPELVNNLGHLAPAVRKGALDTLRVYLVCSRRREEIVRGILTEDLNRSDCQDAFQTNVTLGVILSTPSLLFPSSSSPRPSKQILRHAILALAARLVQVQHQEATTRTLVKIHEVIGSEEFESYLRELGPSTQRDYELLCDVHKVKPTDKNNSRKKIGNKTTKINKINKIVTNGVQKSNEEKIEEHRNDLNANCRLAETPGSAENIGKASIDKIMPSARIVLETEIKFNEETAITMTILEEKNDESDDEEESVADRGEEFVNEDEALLEEKNLDDRQEDEVKDEWIERRKTPRRVHFGGEIVKLRTPDSDESEIVQNAPQTRIPIPISPTTRMPAIRATRSMSNPCSPNVARSRSRKSRSVSNSPKREFYTHDANLSPKKSILLRSAGQASMGSIDDRLEIVGRGEKIGEEKIGRFFGKSREEDRGWAFEIFDNDESVDLGRKEAKIGVKSEPIGDREVYGEGECLMGKKAEIGRKIDSGRSGGKSTIGEPIGDRQVYGEENTSMAKNAEIGRKIDSGRPGGKSTCRSTTGDRQVSGEEDTSTAKNAETGRKIDNGRSGGKSICRSAIGDRQVYGEEEISTAKNAETGRKIDSGKPGGKSTYRSTIGDRQVSGEEDTSTAKNAETGRKIDSGRPGGNSTCRSTTDLPIGDRQVFGQEVTSMVNNAETGRKIDSGKPGGKSTTRSTIGKEETSTANNAETGRKIDIGRPGLKSSCRSTTGSPIGDRQVFGEEETPTANNAETGRKIDRGRSVSKSTRRSTTGDRQDSGEEKTSTANNAETGTKIVIEVDESVKVERIEPVKGSEVTDNGLVESSVATVEDKHENGEASRGAINSSGMKSEAGDRTPEVGEKFESPMEVEAKPLSEPRYRSPVRSPKKPLFESPFPRKERNYILMELSSPVKTAARKINDNAEVGSGDCQLVPIDGSALQRGESPMGSPVGRLQVDPTPSSGGEEKNSELLETSRSEKFDDKCEAQAERSEKIGGEEKDDCPSREATPIQDTIGESACSKFRESNWEELGLVDQEVLNDLHNKDDWRARVRGLERVASALRTSSALMAIESRLGSLLQAVLGGERSCRVAAAGMSVARVVVAGVSEEALRRRLPQVAWGLARQGGPNAAQLARVAMLRLRPALLLEQLLQPHCIKARNAKTRENALQLLIFSLVTFPSTEFKVDNVAGKVAAMVFDRRRRVRQAALDTLAVLAQIYEPEEVMKAGKLAAKGQQDGEAMVAAIRARLARKSLPMVSADGLVVYGLQISPTVQIATGPDVDWIVAGSGSVSPGTGRTRGQIIATTARRGVQEKNAKNESAKNGSNLRGPNFVALGVGLHSKNEQQQPFAWQLVTRSSQDGSHRIVDKQWEPKNRDGTHGDNKYHDVQSRLTGSLRHYRSATDRLDDSFESETTPIFLFNDKDVIMKQRKTEENFHRRMDEIYAERTGIGPAAQDIAGNRLESRIPVPQSRDREANGRETRFGTSYGRRRIQEGNSLKNWSDGSRQRSIQRAIDQSQPEINNSQRHQRASRDTSPRRMSPSRDTYRSIYRQRRAFADGGGVYREVQTAPTTTTTTSRELSRRRRALKDSLGTLDSRTSTEAQTTRDPRTNRRHATADGYGVFNPSDRNRDKNTVDEEDCNDANQRNFSSQTKPYRIQSPNDRSSQCPALLDNGPSETSSNSSSNTSGDDVRLEVLQNSPGNRQCNEESLTSDNDENLRTSPSRSPITEKSFNVITHESNPSRRNSIEYGISTNNAELHTLVYSSTDPDNEAEDTDKGSSTDDASTNPVAQTSNGKFLESLENENGDSSSEVEDTGDHRSARNVSASFVANESDSSSGGISKVSDDSPASNESEEIADGTSNAATSPARIDSIYALSSIEAVGFDNSATSIDENDGPDVTMAFVREFPTDVSSEDPSRGRGASPRVEEDESVAGTLLPSEEELKKLDEEEAEEETGPVKNTLVASRPHSRDSPLHEDASIQALDFRSPREVTGNSAANRIAPTIARPPSGRADESLKTSNSPAVTSSATAPNFRRDSATRGKINRAINTGNETAITLVEVNGAQSGCASEKSEAPRRVATSKVPRIRQKNRTNVSRVAPMPGQSNDKNTTKAKSTTQQCLTQLESNDWESAVKGLKALSEIARQQPEQLDSFGPGTLGRLLGRHVRNLRSQVSRAACLAAGDVFGSQARCIDQELDDIAGPLLHRTADTNKFLRADSNEALDRMVEHLTPNKTILVVVHRGASHQNAVVRAATARLLASIVDRLGPDAVMSLPRDVREKLIASGAKLLMDGNLDARNYAKRMFRRLARCEGFRKALKDSVPEATLRHIDKTLKSL